MLFVTLPFLRTLRALRSVRLLRLVRLASVGVVLGVVWRRVSRLFSRHGFGFGLIFFAAAALVAAAVVREVERGQDGATIKSFGDSIWWSLTTITTVGYGDEYPVSSAGRALAAVLMIVGRDGGGALRRWPAEALRHRVRDREPDRPPLAASGLAGRKYRPKRQY